MHYRNPNRASSVSFYLKSDLFGASVLGVSLYVVIYRQKDEVVRVTVLKHESRHPRFGLDRR